MIIQEACGVFGVLPPEPRAVAGMACRGLYLLPRRQQKEPLFVPAFRNKGRAERRERM